MRPSIEDFISRALVSGDVLLQSCLRLRERADGAASEAVAYVLACEFLESFMGLMHRVSSPRR